MAHEFIKTDVVDGVLVMTRHVHRRATRYNSGIGICGYGGGDHDFQNDGKRPKVKVSVHKATPEELAEHRSFTERSARLREMRAELMQKYPDKRVALTENGMFWWRIPRRKWWRKS